jgi:hypothetical protein
MKSRQSPPLIDPAVLYLAAFFAFVGLVIVVGIAISCGRLPRPLVVNGISRRREK